MRPARARRLILSSRFGTLSSDYLVESSSLKHRFSEPIRMISSNLGTGINTQQYGKILSARSQRANADITARGPPATAHWPKSRALHAARSRAIGAYRPPSATPVHR
jgi:hypothetical protein